MQLKAEPEMAGKVVRCPGCNTKLSIPATAAPPPPSGLPATEREAGMSEAIVKARNHTTAPGNSFRQWYEEIQAILNAALSPAEPTEKNDE